MALVSFTRFGDGVDYLFPGAGDDILISGTLEHGTGVVADTYFVTNFFINEPGNKTIIGFSAKGSEKYNPYTKSMLDRIYIEDDGSINYLSNLQISYDDDGFLELLINSNSKVKLHSIDAGEIDLGNKLFTNHLMI